MKVKKTSVFRSFQGLEKEKSISKASKKLGMSYRHVWSYLQKIEKTIGESIVETHRGGKSGGGGAKLTEISKNLLSEYKNAEVYLGEVFTAKKTGEAKIAKRVIQRRSDRLCVRLLLSFF